MARDVWTVAIVAGVLVVSGVLWFAADTETVQEGNQTAPEEGNELSESYTGDEPPEIVIDAGDAIFEGVPGSYCWSGRCVDTIGPAALVEDLNATTVLAETAYSFAVRDGPEPYTYRYTLHRMDNTIVADGNDSRGFTLPQVEPGTYILVGHGRWEEGDASYAFKIGIDS